MDLGIAGRTALICGASRGMGRAIARQLACEGVEVTLVARRSGPLAEAAAAISAETGRTPRIVAADITTEAGRAAALTGCPTPDILITNADGPAPGDFREYTRADWIAALDALMLAPIALIQATIDPMAARGFGRVVNIVSRSVKIAQAELVLSNGARSGLVGFTAGLSREMARFGVTINNLLPGPFDTDAQRRHVEALAARTGTPFQEVWDARLAANPSGRFGDPAEIGAYCAYLCSALGGFVTGQNLLIDGGAYPGTY